MEDVKELPLLLTKQEVCELARFAASTFERRIADGSMPRPTFSSGRPLWARDSILAALGLGTTREAAGESPVEPHPEFGHWPTDPARILEAYRGLFPELERYECLRFKRVTLPKARVTHQDAMPVPKTLSATIPKRHHSPTDFFEVKSGFKALPGDARDLPTLVSYTVNLHGGFKSSKPSLVRKLLAWSASLGHPDIRWMVGAEIQTFYTESFTSAHVREQLKSTLSRLFKIARSYGWVKDNPVRDTDAIQLPISSTKVWRLEERDLYADVALELGQPGLAALIHTEWEVGQRLEDARAYEFGYHLNGQYLSYWQQKTETFVDIPISADLAQRLAALPLRSDKRVFVEGTTGLPFTANTLNYQFNRVRALCVARGARKLLLRQLRHSCVVELGTHGATAYEIASVTGHSQATVAKLLEVYLPRCSAAAETAQRRRGLVHDTPPIQDDRPVIELVAVRSAWSAAQDEVDARLRLARRVEDASQRRNLSAPRAITHADGARRTPRPRRRKPS